MKKFARKDSVTGKGINDGFCFGDGDFYCASSLDALAKCEQLGYKSIEEAYKEEAYYWTEWEVEEGEIYYNEEGEEFDPIKEIVNTLEQVNNIISKTELIKWFNNNDIEYFDLTDLEMYIYYFKNK